ncbi:hypothetical protein GCM10028805_64790 [Spirosoma harenae]
MLYLSPFTGQESDTVWLVWLAIMALPDRPNSQLFFLTDQKINRLFERTFILTFGIGIRSFAYIDGELFAQ